MGEPPSRPFLSLARAPRRLAGPSSYNRRRNTPEVDKRPGMLGQYGAGPPVRRATLRDSHMKRAGAPRYVARSEVCVFRDCE